MTLVWHSYNGLRLDHNVWNGPHGIDFVYGVAVLQMLGGVAIVFRRYAKIGAVALAAAYLIFAAFWLHRIVASPQHYDLFGNFFEQFSLVLGAAFVYASLSASNRATATRIGGVLLGLCAVSFAVQQARHLDVTATLVPKWIPPSQMFWVTATTVAFALAALALITGRTALLATRLVTAMLGLFGILVWVPILLSNLRDHGNWGETTETFAITGATWIFADLLATKGTGKPTRRARRR